MFPMSTQRNHWTYSDEEVLQKLRIDANHRFIIKHGEDMSDEQRDDFFLSVEEERFVLRHYELQLKDFCRRFNPQMPRAVIGTAFHYFKRFYLNNSVMDYHPKEILVTCVYLACKVEEFNVSIVQFVANVRGDREKATDIILNNELLLMRELHYHLTVHNPYRPVEGLLIDIKTRCGLTDPERLRPGVDELLDKLFLCDAPLLYAPAQLALAAVLHAASRNHENLDSYVTDTLFGPAGRDKLPALVEAVRKIRSMSKPVEPAPRETVRVLERKLDQCRNQANNPDSQIYKRRMQAMLDDEDDREDSAYARVAQRQEASNDALLGITRLKDLTS